LLPAVRPAIEFVFLFVGAAALFQLVNQVLLLSHLVGDENPELHASARLIAVNFKGYFLARQGLLALGSILMPWLGYDLVKNPAAGWGEFCAAVVLAFVLTLAGEAFGRYLFFVTVVPKNMPGSFFRTK
ncbi:MAG: hypothetical protein ACE5GQ_07935, partial [Nitrospinales bacterium]